MLLSLAARGLLAITVISLIAGVAGLTALHHGGYRLLSVRNTNLAPMARPGDAIVIRPTGQLAAVVPGLGRWLDILSRPVVLIVSVYLPAWLLISAEIRRLAHIYTRPLYSVRL